MGALFYLPGKYYATGNVAVFISAQLYFAPDFFFNQSFEPSPSKPANRNQRIETKNGNDQTQPMALINSHHCSLHIS